MSWWEITTNQTIRLIHADTADEALEKVTGALSARYIAGDNESVPYNMRLPEGSDAV